MDIHTVSHILYKLDSFHNIIFVDWKEDYPKKLVDYNNNSILVK